MGGGGNQKWTGHSEPAGTKTTTNQEGGIEGDTVGMPDWKRRKKTEMEKKIEAWKKARSQSPEAVANREQQQKIRTMTPQQRAEHYASNRMLDKYLKKEYSKWVKEGEKGGHQKGWVEGAQKKAMERWKKGGQEKWEQTNKKSAESIREKVRRNENYKSQKRKI